MHLFVDHTTEHKKDFFQMQKLAEIHFCCHLVDNRDTVPVGVKRITPVDKLFVAKTNRYYR